jgi:hypothetical protein
MKTPIECLPSTPDKVLNDLCKRLTWGAESDRVKSASATAELNGHIYGVEVRRYLNLGGEAVKAVVHQRDAEDQCSIYSGALGRHHPEANPYAKTPLGDTFPESSLLAVLGACVVLNPESPTEL